MRFTRIHAKHFGPHRDRDEEVDPKIVLIFGRNESGKSSFRGAVETLLYGFEPASRDKHPLAIWGEGQGELHLEADYALDDGSEQRIERVLQATGKSRLAAAGAAFEGPRKGNNALSVTEGLPRALYRSVYSIETEQLAALAASEQSHVDDLLLPESQSLGLRPIADIRSTLRDDLGAIWRPQKRGNFQLRELDDALNAAHARVRRAEEEETALRDALEERGELEGRLAADKGEKEGLERSERDAPYLREIFELRQHERAHGEAVDLTGLGGRYELRDPEVVEREAEALAEDLLAPIARLERDELSLDPVQTRLLEAVAEIRAAEVAVRSHADNRRSADAGAADARRLRADAARTLDDVLAEPSDASLREALAGLPIAQLESAQERWGLDWEAHATAPPPDAPRPPIWSLFAAALGAGAAIAATLPALPAWAPPLPVWLAPAGIALTLLAAIAAFFLRPRPQAKGDPPACPTAIGELLVAFPVAEGMLESPSGLRRWVESAARARQLLVDAEAAEGESKRLARESDEELATWLATCRRLEIRVEGDGGGDANGPVLVERMRAALERATAAQQRVREDTTQRRTAQTLIDAKQPSLDRQRAHLAALGETLRANVPGAVDLHAAYEELAQRRRAQDYARTRRAELAQDPRWRSFSEDPRANADREPDAAPWNEAVSLERGARLAELEARIESASMRLGELGEILGNDPGSRSARARDVVAKLQEELAEARVTRDRLALLDAVLVRAEQRFREEHQPDVLRRASHYLERVTRGRYDRLDYLDGADSGLFVTCRERSEPVKVDTPISRGTLDQIFLCLRLGLLDHLDSERERLPLILDDALLRMDDVRRPEVYSLLLEVATKRQVFFLTCHRAIADEAEKALATARIELSEA